ncbi:hypothetical protein CDAR_37321 [Caerostris darwini]|uniref:Uncharacterized protein n=1 Tax=Caerostris darwini TaxID=1538125 RepID=A0AAV4TTU3_9ARAC|nr:hypothetical protein CDAR_37321 [Caerostris darwini]
MSYEVQAVPEEQEAEDVRPGGVRGLRGEPTSVRPEPLAASPGGAPVRRLPGQVGDVQRHHPLAVSHQVIAPFHSSPSLLLVASSSLG